MKFIYIVVSGLLFLGGCGEQSSLDIGSYDIRKGEIHISVLSSDANDSLEYLNNYRNMAGLIKLKENEHLKSAAKAHADYLTRNDLYVHIQKNELGGFSGYSPLERALNAGYEGTKIYENIYAGDVLAKESVDILFSNIYHRLAFLSPGIDEAAVAVSRSPLYLYKKVYTYEMGSSKEPFLITKKNPEVIIWPYENQRDVLPCFYEEVPDPLPECGVSGYPISIEFNFGKNKTVKLLSFKLYSGDKEVTDVKLLDKTGDPNGIFTRNQFALMPYERLKQGSEYLVTAEYLKEKEKKVKSWRFRTRALPKPNFTVSSESNLFYVKSGVEYHYDLPPTDCNDKFTKFTYSVSGNVAVEVIEMTDFNTIKIRASGEGRLKVRTDNSKEFTLIVG